MKNKPYYKLLIWQRAHELTVAIYKETTSFPASEKFGLTSQLRRSAASVPTNIVEGYARGGQKEFWRFLSIARASLTEAEYLLELSRDIGFLPLKNFERLEPLRARTSFLLMKFMTSIK
ncbi:four helix bundle protein [Candidatus Uhrbacteria bacterium]|nr:four helix bundle protein [Candidatus Uhrbacteria bacterium]